MSLLSPFAPSRFPYPKFLLGLVVGLLGTAAFGYLHLPLPWMLGSLSACLIAALMRLPVAMPKTVRPPMLMLVGVLLGSGFTPELVAGFGSWIPSLLSLLAFIAISAAGCILYLRRVAGLDFTTAFFAGVPGGLIEMVTLGGERGADTRVIALIHSSRILLIVLSLPWLLSIASGSPIVTDQRIGISIFDAPLSNSFWLLGTGLAGILLGRVLRLQATYLMGPLFVSAAVHLAGLSHFRPPYELIWVAQLVLGASLGCSFAGTRTREILRILGISVGSAVILATTSICFAVTLSYFSGTPVLDLLLAYSPGGLTETSLMALALNVEVGFVATHHVVRVMVITMSATLLFRGYARLARASKDEPAAVTDDTAA